MTPSVAAWPLLAAAGLAAGAINAVAGGGSLLSFPVLVASGLSPIEANATNSAALAPASVASALGYREELGSMWPLVARLLPSAVLGAVLGAELLLATSARAFDKAVPALVLFAVALLGWQQRSRASKVAPELTITPEGAPFPPAVPTSSAPRLAGRAWALASAAELAVGLYGGYFGAGIGILMLALLGHLGVRDLHRANAAKALLAGAINAIATVALVYAGQVDLVATCVVGVSGLAGGYVGARVARRVNPSRVRFTIIAYGVVLALALGAKALRAGGAG
jgi:uncharacterized membrane protein YfcA